MRKLTVVAVLPFVAVGCGGSRAQGPSPEEVRRDAIARAEAAHLDAVGRYTERVAQGEENRIDLALQRHASGEISDKDLIEVVGQIHKQALSRINTDKAILIMERERADAARQLVEALRRHDQRRIEELEERLDSLDRSYRMLQAEVEERRKESVGNGAARPEVSRQ